jgi:NAD+ synthetase
VKIALAQTNPTVGDFAANSIQIEDAVRRAAASHARLIVFPELAIPGYPPADLLDKASFLARCQASVDSLRQLTAELPIAILLGVALPALDGSGKPALNVALLLDRGRTVFQQQKMLLPFYDVFDEQRYFVPATEQFLCEWEGERLAITICEDAWNDKDFWPQRFYPVDPIERLAAERPTLLINISASPYWVGKPAIRMRMLQAIATRHSLPIVFVNQIGGNDSLVFDGSSFALDAAGRCLAQATAFQQDLIFVDSDQLRGSAPLDPRILEIAAESPAASSSVEQELMDALILGTRDYIRKTGFHKALIGLSGGIDSALVAVIATQALGAENVLTLGMPSQYSSPGSIEDSRQLAHNLGVRFEILDIHTIFQTFTQTLQPIFMGCSQDLTEENLQSRIRGTLLMAISNKFSSLVLTTGNKSEMSVGYCTLYGDMVGALAVIGDLLKTRVYDLCHWINREQEIIPQAILSKPPSAELRPDQKDSDSLPPYDVLDPILAAYIERGESTEEIIVRSGFPRPLVESVVALVERSEYKRQQAAPVLKVTPKSFGSGRRFPIAAHRQV